MGNIEIATFGAGCFWCVEAVFQRLKGVQDVIPEYMGGQTENPTYKDICTGTTGHAEVAQITYDSSVISFEELLEVFWTTHDPTTLNRQDGDTGTQYRSVVFYQDDRQQREAKISVMQVASKLWDDPIVTEIAQVEVFYKAETYHHDYYNSNSNQAYCSMVFNPKILKLKNKSANKLKKEYEK